MLNCISVLHEGKPVGMIWGRTFRASGWYVHIQKEDTQGIATSAQDKMAQAYEQSIALH